MTATNDPLPHVTLIVGEEEFLVDRAISRITAAARGREDPAGRSGRDGRGDPDGPGGASDSGEEVEVHQLMPEAVSAGGLAELTQPSLFGERRVIVLRSAQDLNKDAVAALEKYLADPPDDVTLVLTHAGGKKGAKLLEAARRAGARTINCPKVTKFRERLDFVRAEVHAAGRTITEDAARSLLDAVGHDLRELANACGQLVADTAGAIDEETIARYHWGRAEVTGFTVADRAVEGRSADALEQLRWALAVGVSPVLITGALAQGLRAIAKVGGASKSDGQGLARELGMPPWKVDQVRKQLRGWDPEGVSTALRTVAETDAQVKGGGVDAEYALERAVLAIAAARSR